MTKCKKDQRMWILLASLCISPASARQLHLPEQAAKLFTEFYFSVQGEEDVSSFQVSVDDLGLMKVRQGIQSLLTHHPDLGLSQGSLEFWWSTARTLSKPTLGHLHRFTSNVIPLWYPMADEGQSPTLCHPLCMIGCTSIILCMDVHPEFAFTPLERGMKASSFFLSLKTKRQSVSKQDRI